MINIAELLKDCPTGMELDCTMFDDGVKVIFDGVSSEPIGIKILAINGTNRTSHTLTKYGRWTPIKYTKCVIFPKGKTIWEGFVPPCKFKDGDVISNSLGTCIFKGEGVIEGTVNFYCGLSYGTFCVKDEKSNQASHYGNIVEYRLATEKEKDKFFKAIEENGYRWDTETKTLVNLFKPKFKVGDYVTKKGGITVPVLITGVGNEHYYSYTEKSVGGFSIKEQDDWELVPKKFDINTLVPFESRVLVRMDSGNLWKPAIFGCRLEGMYSPYYTLDGSSWGHCIPYEGNEHLIGTREDCVDFYKNWNDND